MDLKLFCYVVSSNDPFPVVISSSLTAGDLKERIKERKPNDLKGIDADSLELFQVSCPSGRGLAEKVKDAIEGIEPLDPTTELSELFPGEPLKKTIHIAVKLPDATVEDVGVTRSSNSSRCIHWAINMVEGSTSFYENDVAAMASVEDFVMAVIQVAKKEWDIETSTVRLAVWKPKDSLALKATISDIKQLGAYSEWAEAVAHNQPISTILGSKLDGFYHVVLEDRLVSLKGSKAIDQVSELPDITTMRSISARRDEYFEYNRPTAPSSGGMTASFATRQGTRYPIDCGRPAHQSHPVPPVLFNETLGQFAEDLRSGTPTPADYIFYADMAQALSSFFADEPARMAKMRSTFSERFPSLFASFDAKPIGKFGTDGALSLLHFDYMKFLIAEGKLEIAGGGAEPYFQVILYYQEMVRLGRLNMKDVFDKSNLPSILLLHFGSHLEVAVSVFSDKPNVQVLGPVIPLHAHPCDESVQEDGARFVYALRTAVASLRMYYERLTESDGPAGNIDFPWPVSYMDELDGKECFFDYTDSFPEKRVFFATRSFDKHPLCIKFTRRYGSEAHRAAADLGIAPKIRGIQLLPFGWQMVVMDDIRGKYQGNFDADDSVKSAIHDALSKLHQEGYVHGDVRDVNVMSRRSEKVDVDSDSSAPPIMLVDFDWSGKIGEVKYPILINTSTVKRPDSVKANVPIAREHDHSMVDLM